MMAEMIEAVFSIDGVTYKVKYTEQGGNIRFRIPWSEYEQWVETTGDSEEVDQLLLEVSTKATEINSRFQDMLFEWVDYMRNKTCS